MCLVLGWLRKPSSLQSCPLVSSLFVLSCLTKGPRDRQPTKSPGCILEIRPDRIDLQVGWLNVELGIPFFFLLDFHSGIMQHDRDQALALQARGQTRDMKKLGANIRAGRICDGAGRLLCTVPVCTGGWMVALPASGPKFTDALNPLMAPAAPSQRHAQRRPV